MDTVFIDSTCVCTYTCLSWQAAKYVEMKSHGDYGIAISTFNIFIVQKIDYVWNLVVAM